MKTLEALNEINSRVVKHPDYEKVMRSYCQIEMVKDHYIRASYEYYPGQSSVPREERDKYYALIRRIANKSIFYIECMKSLLNEEERRADCQTCMDIFSKAINILKKQLLTYKDLDRICFTHDIFCRLEIPYANLKEYDLNGFLGDLLDVHIKKMNNMRRQEIYDGLLEYYHGIINRLDTTVFSEDEFLPAAIILEAYENNDMRGMKNARYFSTIVANELGEIVDDNTIAEIVKKLISQDHINGQVDGKYHFLLCG